MTTDTNSHFDAIVIGTGQAGPALAGRLSDAGMRVAVIERRFFGGTCVNTGCIPTKTLVASAYAAHLAFRAADYGIELEALPRVNMKRVKARMDEVSGTSRSNVESWLRGMHNVTVFEGHARFTGQKEVTIDGATTISADKIFLNVGGRAVVPNIPGIDSVPYLTNATMMDVDFMPEHLIILGGSYIGLEFGQMYRRFGAGVTIIEGGPRLIGREDVEVSDAIADILRKEGVEVRLGAKVMSVSQDGHGIAVHLNDDAEPIRGSHILLATGRRPNTDDLGLDVAGIETDQRGYVVVNDTLETSVPGIWAMGDCNGKGAFTHTAYNDFEIVAANLLDNEPRKVSDRIATYALYIDPPLGRAGLTEHEAVEKGHKVLVGRRPMTRVGRAVEKGETQGFLKVVVDADTRRILGASLLGTGCDEAVHSILDVMYADKPYDLVTHAVHIHPTVSELLPTTLQDLKAP